MDGEKGMAEVVVGNMRMRIRKGLRGEGTVERPRPKEERVEVNVTDIEVPEINVRGLRVEEALEEVDRFVDRAIVHGTPTLKILHGIGTGRLMQAIRDASFGSGLRKGCEKGREQTRA